MEKSTVFSVTLIRLSVSLISPFLILKSKGELQRKLGVCIQVLATFAILQEVVFYPDGFVERVTQAPKLAVLREYLLGVHPRQVRIERSKGHHGYKICSTRLVILPGN